MNCKVGDAGGDVGADVVGEGKGARESEADIDDGISVAVGDEGERGKEVAGEKGAEKAFKDRLPVPGGRVAAELFVVEISVG
jgi:hypothetical protein